MAQYTYAIIAESELSARKLLPAATGLNVGPEWNLLRQTLEAFSNTRLMYLEHWSAGGCAIARWGWKAPETTGPQS